MCIRDSVSPVDSSGRDVAAARTVAPNSAPDRPRSPKNFSPLCSIATPATRVRSAATLKVRTTRPVLWFLLVASCSAILREWPRGLSCPSGASPLSAHGRRFPGPPINQSPVSYTHLRAHETVLDLV